MKIEIPGRKALRIEHLVSDFNGTLAVDGRLRPGVRPRLKKLARDLAIHVVTADTFGRVKKELAGLPLKIAVLPPGRHDRVKAAYARRLGKNSCAALGNGANDRLLLREAALAVCLLLEEGAAPATLKEADVVCRSPGDALDLFLKPRRLAATLRR